MKRTTYNRAWYKRTVVKRRAYARKWYAKNQEKLTAAARARYQLNKVTFLARNRRNYSKAVKAGKRYGRNYPVATRRCPARCECCNGKQKRALSLDHDHKTKKFRGWICGRCNVGLGMLGDTLKGVRCAVAYLRHAK